MASDARVIDDFKATRRYRRHQRLLSDMTFTESARGGIPAAEEWIRRWLAVLRDGSEAEKHGARRGLATMFERRGMYAEAIELLERNIEPGVRGAETLRWLSRMYQAQDDEVRSLEAAVRASHAPVVALEVPPPPTLRATRRLMPVVLMIVVVSSIVGVSLGLIMSLLKP